VHVTKVASKHMTCGESCNFQAGAGSYIDAAGNMLVYGVDYKPSWGSPPLNRFVKFGEFRSLPSSGDTPISAVADSWVELYDDRDYGDRSIIAEYRDRNLRNYDNYDEVDGFEDKASSVKWMIAPGWQYLLFEDKSREGSMSQLGSNQGILQSQSDLGGWSDKVSSSKWAKENIANIADAWVEIFDNDNFKKRRITISGYSGSSISNYNTESFGDKASSVRWQIPSGYTYKLYENDNFGGKQLDLVGDGRIHEHSNLGHITMHRRRRNNWADKVSSSKY